MTTTSHVLAAGPDWRFADIICKAGPQDRSFEEQHRLVSISPVTRGTFQ